MIVQGKTSGINFKEIRIVTQVLMYASAYARVREAMKARLPEVQVVVWHDDHSLTLDGNAVTLDAVAPVAAWMSGDVLGKHQRAISETIAALPSVAWVQTANAGLDNPSYGLMAGRGIRFSKSGAQSIPIAEYVLTYALAHVQGLAFRQAAAAEKEWRTHSFGELWASRWLIFGYGHIGRNVAKRAQAFDCHTTVVRQSGAAADYADEVVSMHNTGASVAAADFVVLACPANDATIGMVDREFLAGMKQGAVLINVARGSLIDEQALIAGLANQQPAQAVLDVFQTEPLPPDNPLWDHEQVTITAHTSNAGSGTRPRGDELFLSNLERLVAGEDPTDVVELSS
jgi:phosphoglycerate dehydrogenase-like enzyme